MQKEQLQQLAKEILMDNKDKVVELSNAIQKEIKESIFDTALESLLNGGLTPSMIEPIKEVKSITKSVSKKLSDVVALIQVASHGKDNYIDLENSTTKSRKSFNTILKRLVGTSTKAVLTNGMNISPYTTKYGKPALRAFMREEEEAKKFWLDEGFTLV